jgi:hypothetical protein
MPAAFLYGQEGHHIEQPPLHRPYRQERGVSGNRSDEAERFRRVAEPERSLIIPNFRSEKTGKET